MSESWTMTAAATESIEVFAPPAAAPAEPVRRSGSWTRSRMWLDCAMLVAAVAVAQFGARAAGVPATPARWLLLFALLVVGISCARGAYAPRIRLSAIDDVWSVLTATAFAAILVLSLRAVIGDHTAVADQMLRLWAFAAVYVGGGRLALDWAEIKARRAGELGKPTLIIGAGNAGKLTARRLLDHPEFGLRPVGFLEEDALEGLASLPAVGASWDLEQIAAQYGIEHVIVTFSGAPDAVLLRLARRCDELGIEVSFVPQLYERMSERFTVDSLGGLALLTPYRPDPKGRQFALKYALDRIIAGALVLLVAPVLGAAAVAVKLGLGSPILFRQRRVGLDGQEFEMLKFRTMRDSSGEEPPAPVKPLPEDTAPGGVEGADRRTRVGSFLRATSIDELPQLLNVVRGEMSLVGPRPERPEFVQMFEERVHGYGDRHRVKAGMTGWAQVHGLRGKTSISDRAEWDNYYIANWSLWLDLKILLMTFFAVLTSFRNVE